MEEFLKGKLSNGVEFTAIEGTGLNFFNAISKAGSDVGQIQKYLIHELILVDGRRMSLDYIDSLSIQDASYLSEIIALMMSPPMPL